MFKRDLETKIKSDIVELWYKDAKKAEMLVGELFITLAVAIAQRHKKNPDKEIVIHGHRKITIAEKK